MRTAGRWWTSRPRWVVIALVLVVALAVGVVVVQGTLSAQSEGIAVMNVSGRQRMLSQRIAALALQADRAVDAERRAEHLTELRLAADVMERSLDALGRGGRVPELDGSPGGIVLDGRLSSSVRTHYYDAPARLDARVRTFVADTRALADTIEAQVSGGPNAEGAPGPEAARLDALVAEAEGPLLVVLDRAVELRQRQQEDTLRRLELASTAAFVILAAALALLARGRARRRTRDASAQARQAEAERFRFLVQGSSDVILVMDADTNVRYVSPAAERLFGYPDGSLVGTPAIELIHPDELTRAAETLGDVLATPGARVETTSWRIRRVDGSWADAEMSSNNLVEDPRVGGIVVNIRDVTPQRAAERARAQEHAFIDAVLDTVAALVVVIRPDGRLERLNRAAELLTGYTTDELRGRHFDALLPPDELAALQAGSAQGGGLPPTNLNHWVTRRGDRRLISWTNTSLLDDGGKVSHLIGTGLDVTDSRRAEEQRHQAEARFRLVFDHAPVGFALAAPDGRVLAANGPLCRLLGRTEDELVGTDLRTALAPEGAASVDAVLRAVADGSQARETAELQVQRPGGAPVWLELGVTAVRDPQGQPLHFVAQLEDVTSQHEAQVELQRQALHDALTGLPNRVLFLDRLAHAAARQQRADAPIALLYLDLDGFKAVNDTYGHAAGDDLLRVVAERLRNAIRPTDTVARLGGDEFAVLCEDLLDARDATVVTGRLQTELERPIEVAGTTVAVGASIGQVVVGRGRFDPAELLAQADAAMYEVKQRSRRGQGRFGAGSEDADPTAAAPVPADEAARLESLRSYQVLDTPHEEVFDDLVRLAAIICETPMAAISLVDGNRQWFKASVGLAVDETPRELAFCAHALTAEDLMVVDDTRADRRFRHHPQVTNAPAIRFYGAAPLRNDDDHVLGTLCVVDTVPRRLRPDQEEALRALGRQVMVHLEQRRRAHSEADPAAGAQGEPAAQPRRDRSRH